MRKKIAAIALSLIGLVASAPSWAAAADDPCQPLIEEMERQKELALANISVEAKAKINLNLTSLKEFGLDVGADAGKYLGAAKSLEDTIEAEQNNQIRAALAPIAQDLRECAKQTVEDRRKAKQGANLPNPLNFRFTLKFKDDKARYVDAKNVVVGVKRPPREFAELPARIKDGWFFEYVAMPSETVPTEIYMARQITESYASTEPAMAVCLERASPLPQNAAAFTAMRCEEGKRSEPCQFDQAIDPGWVKMCKINRSSLPWDFSLIGTAHAATAPAQAWSVPSLLTLQRQQAGNMGFTEFTITSPDLKEERADSFGVALQANGADVRINGLPPDANQTTYDASAPFEYRFGLQNLNFAGARGGCDAVSAQINFFKDGKPVGEPYKLSRSYVALRDAEKVMRTAQGKTFVWTGDYRKPAKEFDREVFVSSVQFGPDNARYKTIDAARKAVETMRETIDRANLSFSGKTVVAVVRPPLKNNSFGIVLGIREDSQQIRFTFDQANASAMLKEALAIRNKTKAGDPLRNAIVADAFIYAVRGDDTQSPKDVCAA